MDTLLRSSIGTSDLEMWHTIHLLRLQWMYMIDMMLKHP